MNIEQAVQNVKPLCGESMKAASAKWDLIAKPIKSLGALEDTVTKLAGILRTADVDISKRGVVVMCGDHGVVDQGVTLTDSVVTTILAENCVKGTTTVCTMAKFINCDIVTVDVGINTTRKTEGMLDRKIMHGTNDMTLGPAMTREQAVAAIEAGIDVAVSMKEKGYQLIATGEMGIGNTTPSAAIAAVMFNLPVPELVGRGAGLLDEGLRRKVTAIEKAIALNKPDRNDVLDVLSKVGGLEIAGMAGLFLGGAAVGLPVMVDGLISSIAAVIASRFCPACKDYMIVSHMSAEPAGRVVMERLEFLPLVTAGMRLGEGTGAMAALTVIDMAVEVYRKTITFPEINMDEYLHFR